MPPSSCTCSALRHQWMLSLESATASSRSTSRSSTRRLFSSTPHRHVSRQRRIMFSWLSGPGAVFKDPAPGSTNYLSAYDTSGRLIRAKGNRSQESDKEAGEEAAEDDDIATAEAAPEAQNEEQNIASGQPIPRERAEDLRPFPMNKAFQSQSILRDETKTDIYDDVVKRGMTVREASEKYQVDIPRVGAVVRLKAVEEQWTSQGRSFATPYARAVTDMLPKTPRGKPHESINDLPVHAATTNQLFYPTSESRQFTRSDAGEVFQHGLLPADARIPHPQMVRTHLRGDEVQHPVHLHPSTAVIAVSAAAAAETQALKGLASNSSSANSSLANSLSSSVSPATSPNPLALPNNKEKRAEMLKQQMREADAASEKAARAKETRRQRKTLVVHGQRADFRFENVTVSDRSVGRFVQGVGHRYGVPHQDRKKGLVKIPTRVG